MKHRFMVLSLCAVARSGLLHAQTPATFNEDLRRVMARPEFRHASFGVEIYDLDAKAPVFALNPDALFTPGSTTKLLTEGAALSVLGANFRFHTPIYRTGEVSPDGVLTGDLVLVASGDPNLSGRTQADGTLAFADMDHAYGGPKSRLVPGDALAALRDLARQVSAAGIRRVSGRVLIDVGLFPEDTRELGTGVMISPIAVNDNVVDITITPGSKIGAPANIVVSPRIAYLRFENRITTAADVEGELGDADTKDNPDGSQTVILSGAIGVQSGPAIYGYPVSSPSRFAASALTLALKDAGVVVDRTPGKVDDRTATTGWYASKFRVAEFVSAPLSEEIKVTLKVSQNLHASMTPFILGAVAGKATKDIDTKGFALERAMLSGAGLNLSGASQSDGAGGSQAAYYSPDFMVHYLAWMAARPDFQVFDRALPILGRDGTLADVQKTAVGAGHVFAKTGTLVATDLLNGAPMLIGKGLAGYTTTPAGKRYAIALYVNHVELSAGGSPVEVAGQALGELASAAYALPIEASARDPR